MGNAQGLAQGADSRDARTATVSPTPSSLDLSDLTAAERKQIETVLGRQYAIEMEEEDRIRALKKELASLERSVAERRRARKGILSCSVCGNALVRSPRGEDDVECVSESGETCHECSNVCCSRCGAATATKAETQWLCKICAKKREFIMKSGLWHPHRRQPNASLTGQSPPPRPAPYQTTLHPTITLTSPDFDDGHVLLGDLHPSHRSASSGSSEVGGFTPPYDVEVPVSHANGNGSGSGGGGGAGRRKTESMMRREKRAAEISSDGDSSAGEIKTRRRRLPDLPADVASKPWASPAAAAKYREKMATLPNGDLMTEARLSQLIQESDALYAIAGVPAPPPSSPVAPRLQESQRRDSHTSVDEPGHPYARIGFRIHVEDDGNDEDDVPDPGYERVRVCREKDAVGYSRLEGTGRSSDPSYASVAEKSSPTRVDQLYAQVDKKKKSRKDREKDAASAMALYAQVKKEKKKKKKTKTSTTENEEKEKEHQDPSTLYAKVDKSKKTKKTKKEIKPIEAEKLRTETASPSKSAQMTKKPTRLPHQAPNTTRVGLESIQSPKGIVKARMALFENMSSPTPASLPPKAKPESLSLAKESSKEEERKEDDNDDEKEEEEEEEAEEGEITAEGSRGSSLLRSLSPTSSVTSFSSSIASISVHMRESPRPPVIVKSNEEIVEVCLRQSTVRSGDHPFGLGFASNGVKLFVQHVDRRSESSRIDVGDELVGIDDETYSANDADRVRELLAQRDSVKLKIKRKTKKGSTFKEKLKEKQRESSPEFSLAEAVRDSPKPDSGSQLGTLNEEEVDREDDDEEEEDEGGRKKSESVFYRDSGLEAELFSPLATSSPVDGISRPDSAAKKKASRQGKMKLFFQRYSQPFGREANRSTSLRSTGSVEGLNATRACVINKATSLPRSLVGSMRELGKFGDEEELSSLSESLSLNEDLVCCSETLEEKAHGDSNLEWHLGKGQILNLTENGETPSSAGKVYLSLMYMNHTLTVEMIEARNLIGQRQSGVQIPYAKVYLFSSGNERLAKQKTKLATRAVDPAFYDRMHFKDVDLEKKYLQVMIWRRSGPAVFSKRRCIGHTFISLDGLELTTKITNWYELFVPSDMKL